MEVGLPDVRPSMHLSLQQWTWRQSWDDWDLKWWNSVNLRPSLAKKSRALLLTRHSVWETSSPLLFQAMEIWGLFHFLYFLKILFIYFFFRERGREGEREGEKHQCVVASCALPTGGPGQQPIHVPWLGIKPVTLWFSGRCSVHWATPTRASSLFLTHAFCPL